MCAKKSKKTIKFQARKISAFIAMIFVATSIAAIALSGCITKIQVIDPKNNHTSEQQMFGSFEDESYVWESWQFSTNQVVK